jgi:hypothetical protein
MKKPGPDLEYGNGHFGKWARDQFNLPAYEYTCMQTVDSAAQTKTSGPDSIDHWHQVGNDRITLTAHNGGYVQFFLADRGMQWLSYHNRQKNCLGGGICFIEENQKVWSDLYNSKLMKDKKSYRRLFGCGYFQKVVENHELSLDNFIYPPFGNDPVVLIEIKIKNNSNRTRKLSVYNYWGIDIKSLVGSLFTALYTTRNRTKFGDSNLISFVLRILKTLLLGLGLTSEQVQDRAGSKFSFESHFLESENCIILVPRYKSRIPVGKDQPADRNYYLDPLFLVSFEKNSPIKKYNEFKILKRGNSFFIQRNYTSKPSGNRCAMLGHEITLEPQEEKCLTFMFGTAKQDQIPGLIEKYRTLIQNNFRTKNFEQWQNSLFSFSGEEPWLNREVTWHSYYLRSATLYDDYFQNHYLPQGNAYTFLHGLNGAIRDYVLFLIPMLYMNPDIAREMLEYIFRTMAPNGKLPYALTGYGQQMGAIVHESSSDLHLFLLWGLLEYLFTTRDFQFLEKVIPFYPLSCGKSSTVLKRIILGLQFLFQKVGIGEHGMIKVGSGDWSDGVSLLVKSRGAFLKKGESTFNSAFALYIIPPLLRLLEKKSPQITAFLQQQYAELKKACLASWSGKWFYRGYDGLGAPLGDKNLFLEHHVWLLLSGVIPQSQAQILIDNIYKLLDTSSKIGQYVLYPPMNAFLNTLPQGWDVNGGIWHAMNFLLTWAYSKYDSTKAYQSLLKNSMARRAEIYPNIWYGIWSGSDSYNAAYAPNPGQTFIHPATPQTDFPVMNLNLHANFLNSIIRLIGINFTLDGLEIDPKLPCEDFRLKTPRIALDVKPMRITGFYKPLKQDECVIRVRKPKNWSGKIVALIEKQNAGKNFSIEGDWLILKVLLPETGLHFSLEHQI